MTTTHGYHGTSEAAAQALLNGEPWRPSRKEYDWLGDGVYFWQDSPSRAWSWARERHGAEAAVLGAEIDLDGCLDLLDTRWFRVLQGAHDGVLEQLEAAGVAPPVQRGLRHGMDRLVVNYAVGALAERGIIVRSCRAAFAEGEPAFPGSSLFSLSHVQIAVRDSTVLHNLALEAP